VRLRKGDFTAKTEYDADPVAAARRWVGDGARALHVVDLDGARTGRPQNLEHVSRIIGELGVSIQVGGGLRSIDSVREAVERGARRVVLGTAAFRDVDFLDEAVAQYGDRVLVSVDGRGGKLAAAGWQEQTDIPVEAVIERLMTRGVRRFVYSSIDRDGTLEGPDLEGAKRVAGTVRGSFVYSGGIGSLADLRGLVALRQVNMSAVIVGKALYEGRFTVAQANSALQERCTTSE
jgi:phosphoribosylformimino-5-aminoimidazole carboxamide ribotide isomerase